MDISDDHTRAEEMQQEHGYKIVCITNVCPTETTVIRSLNYKFIVRFTSRNNIYNTHQTEFTLTCLHASSETKVVLFNIMSVKFVEEKKKMSHSPSAIQRVN